MATVSDREEVADALKLLQDALEKKYPRTTDDGPYIQIRPNGFELINSEGGIMADTRVSKMLAAILTEDE